MSLTKQLVLLITEWRAVEIDPTMQVGLHQAADELEDLLRIEIDKREGRLAVDLNLLNDLEAS